MIITASCHIKSVLFSQTDDRILHLFRETGIIRLQPPDAESYEPPDSLIQLLTDYQFAAAAVDRMGQNGNAAAFYYAYDDFLRAEIERLELYLVDIIVDRGLF